MTVPLLTGSRPASWSSTTNRRVRSFCKLRSRRGADEVVEALAVRDFAFQGYVTCPRPADRSACRTTALRRLRSASGLHAGQPARPGAGDGDKVALDASGRLLHRRRDDDR